MASNEIEIGVIPSTPITTEAPSNPIPTETAPLNPPQGSANPEGSERPSERGEEELEIIKTAAKAMAKYEDIIVVENGDNLVWLGSREDLSRFEEIKRWKEENPEATIVDAMSHFIVGDLKALEENGDHSDALVKVIYHSRDVDYVLKFEDKGKLGTVRVAWERKLVKAGLILELDSVFDPTEAFVKVYAPFATLCKEAEKKTLRMPLLVDAENFSLGVEKAGPEEIPAEALTKEKAVERTLGKRLTAEVQKQLDEQMAIPTTFDGMVSKTLDFFNPNEHIEPQASARFQLQNIAQFLGGDDLFPCEGTSPVVNLIFSFFPRNKRNLLTYYILTKILLSPVEVRELNSPHVSTQHSLGVNQLLRLGAYSQFFPIHDGSPNTKPGQAPNLRAWLKAHWCRKVASFQPLDQIRDYFGEKIAMYFAFLGFYTTWLWLPALVGVGCFAYGVYYGITGFGDEHPESEFQSIQSGAGRVFDNPTTIPFSAFMCIWATLFIEFWKRKNAYLAWWWDVMSYEQNEVPRPEWYGTKVRRSVVTGKREYFYPENVKVAKMTASCFCIWIAIMIVLLSVMGTVVYTAWATNFFGECTFTNPLEMRYCVEKNFTVPHNVSCSDPCYTFLTEPSCTAPNFTVDGVSYPNCTWFGNFSTCGPACANYPRGIPCTLSLTGISSELRPSCTWRDTHFISDITASILNLFAIVVLNKIFEYVARILNDWENHKTQTLWEDSLVQKTFFFQFLNSYTTLFYIAFFKGTLAKHILGRDDLRDACEYGSCFNELMIQLAIVFIGKQVISQIVEILIPLAKKHLRKRMEEYELKDLEEKYQAILQKNPHLISPSGSKSAPQWVKDDYLDPYEGVLFDEYNEIALQFGFITLFVAAFPLAPLFALLNNLVEIRTDSYKLITSYQRPPALQARDIGTWESIMNILGILAVITNSFLVAFISDWVRQTLEEYAITYEWFNILAAKLIFIIIFEHVVIGLKILITVLVPDVPAPVQLAIDRENYLGRLALEGITEDDVMEETDMINDLFGGVTADIRQAQQVAKSHLTLFKGEIENSVK